MARAVIVVPCYNEAERLDARQFADFTRRQDCADFLFVNDGSRDGTQAVLERLQAIDPQRCGVLHLPQNCGKAEAVRRGILTALERRPRYVGFWDADLATPLEDIPGFCRVLDDKPGVEMVIGTRLPLLGRAIERRPLRNLCGKVFAVAASAVLGVRFQDTQCGAKLLRVGSETRDWFVDPFICRWIFDVELMARIAVSRRTRGQTPLGHMVYEYPLDQWRDVGGSKVRAQDFSIAFIDMGRIYWTYLRPRAAWLPSGRDSVAVPLPADAAVAPPLAATDERQAA